MRRRADPLRPYRHAGGETRRVEARLPRGRRRLVSLRNPPERKGARARAQTGLSHRLLADRQQRSRHRTGRIPELGARHRAGEIRHALPAPCSQIALRQMPGNPGGGAPPPPNRRPAVLSYFRRAASMRFRVSGRSSSGVPAGLRRKPLSGAVPAWCAPKTGSLPADGFSGSGTQAEPRAGYYSPSTGLNLF